MGLWIGVDVGGTFTDLIGFDDDSGRVRVHKIASTPADPAAAIMRGIEELIAKIGAPAETLREITHGTTVGTNALIQRKGARVALITTDGFRDLLEIGFQNRPYVYDLHRDIPPPVVPRVRRFEVKERITAGGEVVEPLTVDEIARVVDTVGSARAEAIAVCLLFAYLRPDHERLLAVALQARYPDAFISLSSEVQPEFREYQRFSTTVLNAYLQPLMGRYLASLRNEIARRYPRARVSISHSNGGLMDVNTAARFPIRTALSGPAAGVAGAVDIARRRGCADAITFDMGGTSTDVAMIRGHAVGHAYDSTIGGYPVRLPMLDVVTVGAGGGSIAWFDRDDLLKVGPISAGAVPGPACYGIGGSQATVTDANLVLGRLSPTGLLGGRMALNGPAAHAAIRPLADRLGIGVERAALGIIDIVVSNMVRAIRAVSVERGYDPRELTLLPFGGGGPLHARAVAVELGMTYILVPSHPGILCAAGLMTAPLVENYVATIHKPLAGAGLSDAARSLSLLVAAAERWFDSQQVLASKRRYEGSLDLAYEGQSYELSVPLPSDGDAGHPVLPSATEARRMFMQAHERAYGYSSADDPVIVTNCRLRALGLRLAGSFRTDAAEAEQAPEASSERMIWFEHVGPRRTPVLDRTGLAIGATIDGPAVIEQYDSTVLLFPRDRATVDADRNLAIEIRS